MAQVPSIRKADLLGEIAIVFFKSFADIREFLSFELPVSTLRGGPVVGCHLALYERVRSRLDDKNVSCPLSSKAIPSNQ